MVQIYKNLIKDSQIMNFNHRKMSLSFQLILFNISEEENEYCIMQSLTSQKNHNCIKLFNRRNEKWKHANQDAEQNFSEHGKNTLLW
jgi:hypothetical protein